MLLSWFRCMLPKVRPYNQYCGPDLSLLCSRAHCPPVSRQDELRVGMVGHACFLFPPTVTRRSAWGLDHTRLSFGQLRFLAIYPRNQLAVQFIHFAIRGGFATEAVRKEVCRGLVCVVVRLLKGDPLIGASYVHRRRECRSIALYSLHPVAQYESALIAWVSRCRERCM